MNLIKSFRFWQSRRYFGTPVGEWDTTRSYLYARRLLPSGDYEYRAMTKDEVEDLVSSSAW